MKKVLTTMPFWFCVKNLNFINDKNDNMKSGSDKNHSIKINAKISDKVRDYGNDPFFVKKANESKKFLEKHGFPKELLKMRDE